MGPLGPQACTYPVACTDLGRTAALAWGGKAGCMACLVEACRRGPSAPYASGPPPGAYAPWLRIPPAPCARDGLGQGDWGMAPIATLGDRGVREGHDLFPGVRRAAVKAGHTFLDGCSTPVPCRASMEAAWGADRQGIALGRDIQFLGMGLERQLAILRALAVSEAESRTRLQTASSGACGAERRGLLVGEEALASSPWEGRWGPWVGEEGVASSP